MSIWATIFGMLTIVGVVIVVGGGLRVFYLLGREIGSRLEYRKPFSQLTDPQHISNANFDGGAAVVIFLALIIGGYFLGQELYL